VVVAALFGARRGAAKKLCAGAVSRSSWAQGRRVRVTDSLDDDARASEAVARAPRMIAAEMLRMLDFLRGKGPRAAL